MKNTNLVYLIKDTHLLLGLKKRGFGIGKWNGLGGKKDGTESIEEAAVREMKEEIGVQIVVEDLEKVGEIDFHFTNHGVGKKWDQKVHVFLVRQWTGEPTETEEIRPRWFSIEKLPYKDMWKDDPYWMPIVLSGKKIKAIFKFGEDNEHVIEHKIDVVDGFS